MAKLIGTVRQAVGEVVAVAQDGGRRALSVGDALYAGERILTASGAAVAVDLANGGELTLGRDSDYQLTEQLLADPQAEPASAPPSAEQVASVEEVQRAIAAGDDPTLAGEAPAAGPGAGAGAGAGAGGAGGGTPLSCWMRWVVRLIR